MAENEERKQQPEKVTGSDRQSAGEEQSRAVEEDHSLKVHGDKLEKLIPKGEKDR